MPGLSQSVASWALASALTLACRSRWRRLLHAAAAPEPAQNAALQRIVHANANTEFGGAHGFSSIDNVDDFRRAVPVQTFESLRSYAEMQDRTGTPCLTAAPPVFYQRTSGTLGAPKDVPLTQAGIERIRHQQTMAAYAQHKGSGLFAGKILGIGSPAVEGRTPGGKPYGSATGLIYENQPMPVRAKFVLPPVVFAIADYDARYYAIAALGLAEPRVTGLATANPSTLVKLLGVINERAEALLRDISEGRLAQADHLTFVQRHALSAGLRPAPQRARELNAILQRTGRLSYRDIWPDLSGVVTWMGGSCAVPLSALRPQLPETAQLIEAGYVSSEFRGTLNVDVGRNLCLPTVHDNYFEFVQRDAWERGEDNFLRLDELEAGEFYYPIVTTADGLYRYDINDVVTVTGKIGATPTLAFVQKGKGVTSITGEKLTEAQLLDAIGRAAEELGFELEFFVALAGEDSAGYVLYVETAGNAPPPASAIADAVEQRLCALNSEYAAKRASGRLTRLSTQHLRPGSGDAFRRHCVAAGQREAQFKVQHLQYTSEASFAFADHVAQGERA